MATKTSIKELRAMQHTDLLKEIRSQADLVAKLRLGVKLGKEKNSAKYIAERKQLARMKTVYVSLEKEQKTTKDTSPKAKKTVSSGSRKTADAKKSASTRSSATS